jgi:hypothetical protein
VLILCVTPPHSSSFQPTPAKVRISGKPWLASLAIWEAARWFLATQTPTIRGSQLNRAVLLKDCGKLPAVIGNHAVPAARFKVSELWRSRSRPLRNERGRPKRDGTFIKEATISNMWKMRKAL